MIRWFARNDIAANFLMVAILVGGCWAAYFKLPLEIQPTVEFNRVDVRMSYRGATPEDVETTIVIPIERALEDLAGVESIGVSVSSGRARFRIRANEDANLKEMLEEVQRRVDGISTFPNETERPRISIPSTEAWWEVASVIVAGDLEESELLKATNQVRDELLALPEISQVSLRGNRTREISIEADPNVLRSYRLSLQDLSDAIRKSSIDLPAGSIDSSAGRLNLRTKSQAYSREDFENIVISAAEGAEVRLGDIANVSDGFEQQRQILRFNGTPCLRIEVLRSGDESALKISDAVKGYMAKKNASLPTGLSIGIWDDESISLRGRLNTLGWSLAQGALLVMILLGLFLRPMIAFWVVLGIPVSFAGGLLMMHFFGMTINMMSLFGFIIVVGIVVDDAIVTGENIYSKLREGLEPLEGAVFGTKEVATPVTFGVITTIVAFLPLATVDGFIGAFTRQIPPVVGAVLIFSLIESKLVLPSHLKRIKVHRKNLNRFSRFQKTIADSLEIFVETVYRPSLTVATNHRYVSLACFVALAMICLGIWKSGKMGFQATPSVDRYQVSAYLKMVEDTPFDRTDEMVLHITNAARQLATEFRDPEGDVPLITNILASTGMSRYGRAGQDNEGSISIEIRPPSMRSKATEDIKNEVFEKRWRELIGKIDDARSLRIRSQQHRGRMDDMKVIDIELRGPDSPAKTAVADSIEALFETSKKIDSAWHDIQKQRDELEIKLKPRARDLGLTEQQLARQVRSSFFGAEAQRIQRDREEIRVMVRLPKDLRENLHTLESLKINIAGGPPVPFSHVADLAVVKAPASIDRMDGARIAHIYAQPLDKNVNIVDLARAKEKDVSELVAKVPGLSWRYQGAIAEHEATGNQTKVSGIILFFTLYALLAIPFRSLTQPIFVLLAIPFGVIGALLGHLLLDETPSFFSIFGMLALAGVVVNDSLVMVDFTNQRVQAGARLRDAVLDSGASRFRPILLTSLTTFVGLLPLILDKSIQAKFLIPMAISLAFGILFATAITLYLIPCAYLVNEDLKRHFFRAWNWYKAPFGGDEEKEA